MALTAKDLIRIRIEILEIELLSLKARHQAMDEYLTDRVEKRLIEAQISALEEKFETTMEVYHIGS